MNHQDFHHKFIGEHKDLRAVIAVIFAIFLITLTIFTVVSIQDKAKGGEPKNTITVTATGEIYAKPDLALISFSVVTEAKTVTEAMSQNTEKMNSIIEFIKGQGVESKDLKTTSFNIYPRYEYRRVEPEIYPYPPGKRVLVGYEITQQLEVKIRDLDKIGQIIEGATNAGANQAGNLQFTIDNQDELKDQAREEAIDKAKDKAKELAKQLGVRLKRITDFSESGYTPRFYEYAKEASVPMGIGGGAPDIETGENKISVTVNITYEID